MEGAANPPGVCVTGAASLPGAGVAVPHVPGAELQFPQPQHQLGQHTGTGSTNESCTVRFAEGTFLPQNS